MMSRLAALTALALLFASCAAPEEQASQQATTTGVTTASTATTDGAEPTTTEVFPLQTVPRNNADLLALAKQARSDLAAHLEVAEEEIAITGASAVVWNDGSIGCPEPGMSYTQALVDGARVTLLHDDVPYSYHLGSDGLFLCEEPAEDSFTVSKDDSGELEMTPPPGFDE
ncbi:MAG TPA: hypothetical protein VMS99_13380 [Acidimicrobiia bacterium]|nr:hypothetical protein [Acidimicrobiia bacterium]